MSEQDVSSGTEGPGGAGKRPEPRPLTDAEIAKLAEERARRFLEDAPTSAAQAAKIILDGVKADRWRILVGADAEKIDRLVRTAPERAYDIDFFHDLARDVGWKVGS